MAEYVTLTDAHIEIGDVILAEEGTSVAIAVSAEAPSIGVFGQRNVKVFPDGPQSWTFEVEGVLSETTNGASLFAMIGTEVPVKVRASSAAVSEANPSYEGSIVVTEYTPLTGEHGAMRLFSLSGIGSTNLERITTAA